MNDPSTKKAVPIKSGSSTHEQRRIALEIIDRLRAHERQISCAEHRADARKCLRSGACVEEHEAERDEKERIDVAEDAVLFQYRQQYELFKKQQDRKPQPPEDERPRGAVPQSCCKPDDENVQQLAASPAAAEGDIEVVAEPRAERDVPPAPELGDAGRNIGIVEILRKAEA